VNEMSFKKHTKWWSNRGP